jgi:Protein of unknown function (DUF559)
MLLSSCGLNGASLRPAAVAIFGEHHVRTAIARGEVSSPWRGILMEAQRALDPLTIATAGWLAGGPRAVVVGTTAAYLHGCRSVAATPVHVAVPYETRRRSQPGLHVHNAVGLEPDRQVVEGLPVLNLERVVTDLLCGLAPSDALALADEVLAQVPAIERAEWRSRIAQRITRRPDNRGTRVGMRVLELATGRSRSPAESWLLWRIVDLGFPVPEVNWWVPDIAGQPLYCVDLAWPLLRILVEYDGHAAHVGREERDEARERDLRRRGWIVVRVRSDDLAEIGRVERELHEAFRARGMDLRSRTPGSLGPRRHRDHKAS